MTTTLYRFTNDLRLTDNAALSQAASLSDKLICVYCVNPSWFRMGNYQSRPMGDHRWRFLYQSLRDLDRHLEALGQRLLVLYDKPETSLRRLCSALKVDLLLQSHPSCFDELTEWDRLEFPGVHKRLIWTHTLFTPDHLPFPLEQLPGHFTAFRKEVESLYVPDPLAPPGSLPPPPVTLPLSDWNQLPDASKGDSALSGGSEGAAERLEYYFSSRLPDSYKATRNALQGRDNSTGFSPWLANGALSPRQIAQALYQYETRHGASESSGWIYFELLWREYFHWYARKHGSQLFQFRGIKTQPPLTTFYPSRFRKWTQGATPSPLVNACMNELRETGWLSNRGRQLAASYLVNELGVDWRYGAAWFEQQLVDYDPAANWGNWQYIAGVGADPRGGRHFDIEWQREQYDPDDAYVKRWTSSQAAALPLDSVDCADWPVIHNADDGEAKDEENQRD
ncbi:DASH family cryptochrome [Marinobacterium mangrovicola]|uniref:Cryptochrome DASH n=1 Tax=Marinobacterium mangrovicola TaxID=1476959 RepID=A0A4R1GBN3_9GAMM|nr:DASH family cryptochrome [Marinobacterium mangrovicola]TCK03079.1 deoxyribodipyrimidine photo-lyase (single-stranded DNA-specific) [Marinobacterium mangrovicola]